MALKKIGAVCLVLFGLTLYSSAQGISVEARGSYFRPSCSCFSEIYGGGLYYGGEVNMNVWGGLGLWAGVDYFSKTGSLSYTEEETTLRITPVFLGAQIQMPLPRYRPYAGIGLGYFSYRETNPIGTVEDGNIGYIVQAGCRIQIAWRFFIDIRGSFSRCIVKPDEIEANLGGTQLGFGLGIEL